MNWKTWLPLVLALGLGLVAAKVARDVIVRGRHGGFSGQVVQIAIAKRDVEPGHAIQEGDVKLGTVAAGSIPRTAFRAMGDVVGRVVTQPIVKDQPILETLLAPTGSGTGPQALVPQGMRAVTVEVTEATGVGGLLIPGCRVDVISTLQDDQNSRRMTRTIVENAAVLAVGHRIAGAKREEEEPTKARSITLIVTPQEAQLIELASNTGRTRLVMRGPLDRGSAGAEGITLAELLGPAAKRTTNVEPVAATTRPAEPQHIAVIPQPRPETPKVEAPKPRKKVIEVIVAGKLTTVEFELPPEPSNNAVTGDSGGSQPLIPGRAP